MIIAHCSFSPRFIVLINISLLWKQVTVVQWPKVKSGIDSDFDVLDNVLNEIDCGEDALLFPEEGAVEVGLFPWGNNSNSNCNSINEQDYEEEENVFKSIVTSTSKNSMKRKKRLIVIESNWPIGNTMVKTLRLALQSKRGQEEADKLRSVTLREGIIGQYWRFQSVGHGAVSTIEAIYHAALGAARGRQEMEGTSDTVDTQKEYDAENGKYSELLVLFRLQRLKLFLNCQEGQGKGLPRAMRVTGHGIGDWTTVLRTHGLADVEKVELDDVVAIRKSAAAAIPNL